MTRLSSLLRVAQEYRPVLRLALLAVGLLAVGLGVAAPECFPDDNGC
ncbi:MAG TPA: hypothetical protein VFX49_11140 [Chloroflexota bacterium]|nr:hypothetical protein [Chloroflexota bacterium]